MFFFDFNNFCLKMTAFWRNCKPHDFEDLWKFNLSWVKWCSLKGLKSEICWFKIQIWSTFSDVIEFYTPSKIFQIKKFPQFEAKPYYVPSLCFLKAKNWDIETLETALESSNSVLFNRLELKGLLGSSNKVHSLSNVVMQTFRVGSGDDVSTNSQKYP